MIILIDVGTDIVPAVALAYEEPEDTIMQIPPRSPDSHLITAKLMFMSYMIYGMMQTFAAYFAWCFVYYDYGFTINDLLGSGIGYRDAWDSEMMVEERKRFFTNMCLENSYYQINNVLALGQNCEQDFKEHLKFVLGIAQSAFLMTIVWAQLISLFNRKTQLASVVNIYRIFNNRVIWYSILCEIAIIVIVIYVPGLNTALLLSHVPPKYACTGLWIIPWLLIFDEVRKLICRSEKQDGCLRTCTTF